MRDSMISGVVAITDDGNVVNQVLPSGDCCRLSVPGWSTSMRTRHLVNDAPPALRSVRSIVTFAGAELELNVALALTVTPVGLRLMALTQVSMMGLVSSP